MRPSILLSAIAKECWFCSVDIQNININMLVDTGSVVTILSKQVFDKIHTESVPALHAVESNLTVADGGILTNYGKVSMDFRIGCCSFSQDTIVAGLQGINGIIGLDFLEKTSWSYRSSKG